MSPRRAPRRLRAGGALLAALLSSAATGEPLPSPPEEAASGSFSGSPPPEELEGVRLGQSRSSLAGRFGLGGQVPLTEGEELKFTLDPQMPLPAAVHRELEAIGARWMEIRFREDRVSSVRVEYGGQEELLFGDMERRLRERFGEPSRRIERGPLQVGRRRGIRLYLWLRIWGWDWEDRTLEVKGRHYGDDKRDEAPARHEYVFTLSRR